MNEIYFVRSLNTGVKDTAIYKDGEFYLEIGVMIQYPIEWLYEPK